MQRNPSYLDWIKRDQLLVSWLLSYLSEAMLGHVVRCSSAAEIWKILENLFQNHSNARILQLRSQLHTQKKGTLSIDEYMLKMREIADNLITAGQKVSDDELIMNILEGVCAEFDAVLVNLTSRTAHYIIPEVHFALQTHEIRLQKHHASLQFHRLLKISLLTHMEVIIVVVAEVDLVVVEVARSTKIAFHASYAGNLIMWLTNASRGLMSPSLVLLLCKHLHNRNHHKLT